MWHEYPIPANFDKQKEIIRKLRGWIQQLESDNLIVGFAFNHYYGTAQNSDEPDELRVRFEFSDEENRDVVESELESEVGKLVPDYVIEERCWGSDVTERHVLQAYEFGSRCAFLAWEQVERGRFPESYFSQASIVQTKAGVAARRVPLEFQTHFSRGVMNSLGVPRVPDERAMLIKNLMESTGSASKQELIDWLQANLQR